jgi:hypothetical protein
VARYDDAARGVYCCCRSDLPGRARREQMRPYVVRQGDSCATLSLRYGFDIDTVWNDPANDDLRGLRSDPYVLAPLDVPYIPDDDGPNPISLATGATNGFTADVPSLYGQIVCIGPDDQPLAGAPLGGGGDE